MDLVSMSVDQLFRQVDDLWLLALIGAFFVMICESAKPKPLEGEPRSAPQGLALLVMILSLLTPLLLLIHAFASGGAPIGVITVIGIAIVGSAIIGGVIGWMSRDIGRTLNCAAPFLAVPVFALTVYVTWRSVGTFANLIAGMFAY